MSDIFRTSAPPIQPVATSQPGPRAFPSIPDAIKKRFPEAAEWDKEIASWHAKLRSALAATQEELGDSVNRIQQDVASATKYSLKLKKETDSSVATILLEYATKVYADGAIEAYKNEVLDLTKEYTDIEVASVNSNITNNYSTKAYADGAAEAKKSEAISTSALYTDGQISTLTGSVSGLQSIVTGIQENYATKIDAQGYASAEKHLAIIAAADYTNGQIIGLNGTVSGLQSTVANITEDYATKIDAQGYAEAKKNEAIVASNDFTNGQITSISGTLSGLQSTVASIETNYITFTDATGLVEASKQETLTTAQNYTDGEITTISGTVSGLQSSVATIETEFATKVDAQGYASASKAEAISSARDYTDGEVVTLNGTISGVEFEVAEIVTNYATKIDAQGYAEAEAQEAITAANNFTSSQINIVSTAVAALDGYSKATYSLTATAGNVVTGMKIRSESGPDTVVSDVTFQASTFKIQTDNGAATPFSISGGVVTINQLQIGLSNITGTGSLASKSSVNYGTDVVGEKPPGNADRTLSAIEGGLLITAGGLTISGGEIKSGNFVDGQTGWKLGSDGILKAYGAVFTGTMQALTVAGEGLIISSSTGIRCTSGVLTITGGPTNNGSATAAQIDLQSFGAGGNLVLNACSNGGHIALWTGGQGRVVINPAGIVEITESLKVNGGYRDGNGNYVVGNRFTSRPTDVATIINCLVHHGLCA